MIYGLALAHKMGLLEGWTAYYFGNMEEWCDGIACHALVEHEGMRPDFVVIGEPTKMQVYRGHKGRVEMQVVSKGRSAHAASNHLGDNAIYKVLPVIDGVANLEPQLGDHPFLGNGKITVTDMKVETPSINAVPDQATVYIDRRLTFGETAEGAIQQVRDLIPATHQANGEINVEMLKYDEPSYTGFVFPVDKYFPAWALDESHPLVQAGLQAAQAIGLPEHARGQVELQHQRHLLGGQGRHPVDRLWPRRRGDRAHRQRQCDPGRRGEGHRVLRRAAGAAQEPSLEAASAA